MLFAWQIATEAYSLCVASLIEVCNQKSTNRGRLFSPSLIKKIAMFTDFIFKAKEYDYNIIRQNGSDKAVYPYFRNIEGKQEMWGVSPHHGRSYVVDRQGNRFIISKGNGLSYTTHSYIHTGEFGDNTWGILLQNPAIRDFELGLEIERLGIKTNKMEYVLELTYDFRLTNGEIIRPVLLQYSVESPYRICDVPYMSQLEIYQEVEKWEKLNDKNLDERYLVAANVLIRNLHILHKHQILHNAIHYQNYTWALELLDFELACSPTHQYPNEEDRSIVPSLFNRELLYTYEVINHIAASLGEKINHSQIEKLFLEYGFKI